MPEMLKRSFMAELRERTSLEGESLSEWGKGFRALTKDDKVELKDELIREGIQFK